MKRTGMHIFLFITGVILCAAAFFGWRTHLRAQDEAAAVYRETHSFFENIGICGDLSRPEEARIRLVRRREGVWTAYVPADLTEQAFCEFDYFDTICFYPEEGDVSVLSLEKGDRFSCRGLAEMIVSREETPSETTPAGDPGQSDGTTEEEGTVSFRCRAAVLDRHGDVQEEAEILFFLAENVPTLYLDTESGSMDNINADRAVREKGQYTFCRADGVVDTSGNCTIHGRGNSSWKADKKQYSLNLSSRETILGMEASSKFALVANHSDPSLLRNRVTYDIAARCGMPGTPQTAYVNVYFNGVYNGLYLLAQRPNARGGSVHIADLERANRAAGLTAEDAEQTAEGAEETAENAAQTAEDAEQTAEGAEETAEDAEQTAEGAEETAENAAQTAEDAENTAEKTAETAAGSAAGGEAALPENITGGYLLEMDGRYEDEPHWFETQRHHFVVKFPEDIPEGEASYISDYVREAEEAFYSADGIHPETGKSWDEYLDGDSWVKMYILQDFFAQWDVESFSFFVYKDADDPLLYCGPAWDFDLSMGKSGVGNLPDILQRSMWLRDHREGWLTQLDSHADFSARREACTLETFLPAVEDYLETDFPDLISALEVSARMDSHCWREENTFAESALELGEWIRGRGEFYRGMLEHPEDYCTVTFRYGFADMDVYVLRGEEIGFVPTEEYGEHLYSSFRKKYGETTGWEDEDGTELTPQTVIGKDQVFVPVSHEQP